jgi:hypothetical protein
MAIIEITTNVILDTEEEFEDCDLLIEYDYSPEQKEIIHPVDNSQQGFPAAVDIYAVFALNGELADVTGGHKYDFYSQIDKKCLEHIEELIMESIQ